MHVDPTRGGSNASTEAKASSLLAAAGQQTPVPDILFPSPPASDEWLLPPELLPLSRTTVFSSMTEAERIRYSRYEAAALFGAAIWFENLLMQMLLRHTARIPIDSATFRFLLREVSDECSHSATFGAFVEWTGAPAFMPSTDTPIAKQMAALPFESPAPEIGLLLTYALIFAAEESFDRYLRLALREQGTHELVRSIASFHIREEARHISFAKSMIADLWADASVETRSRFARLLPDASLAVMQVLFVNPQVSRALSLPGGAQAARKSLREKGFYGVLLGSYTRFLASLNVIAEASFPAWKRCGIAVE
jgi:hypothetical protein